MIAIGVARSSLVFGYGSAGASSASAANDGKQCGRGTGAWGRSVSVLRRRRIELFASIRRYRLRGGSMDELTRRVDEGFAEDIGRQPGFVAYEFMDCGDGEILTFSVFAEAGQAE